jgi:hypothetical protein
VQRLVGRGRPPDQLQLRALLDDRLDADPDDLMVINMEDPYGHAVSLEPRTLRLHRK